MKRCAALVLAGILAVGSLMLWLGIPAAWLWLFSKLTGRYLEAALGTTAGCLLTTVF